MSEQRIINTYDQCVAAGGDKIFISYHARDARACMSSKWVVHRYRNGEAIVTDPKASWFDYGRMTFLVCGRDDRKPRLAETIAWVKKKYGKSDFVRNRMGDYVEREVNEKFPIPKRP